jgi:hypothetical protein
LKDSGKGEGSIFEEVLPWFQILPIMINIHTEKRDLSHPGPQNTRIQILLPSTIAADRTTEKRQLNPWSRVHLENLIVAQLVKKFPAFYGT